MENRKETWMEGGEETQLQDRKEGRVEDREEAWMEGWLGSSVENSEETNLGEAKARGLEGREGPIDPYWEKEGMGLREEARVERQGGRRKSARMGRKDSTGVEEGVEASVGESLGTNREPWMGLKQFPT